MIRIASLLMATTALAAKASAQNCSLFCNGDFDSLGVTLSVGLLDQDSTPCWHTTSPDSIIEVWHTGFNGVPSYNGIQHIEMNAYQPATLYQNIPVNYSEISISFAHIGRGGVDTVGISIGPVAGPWVELGRFGDDNSAWVYRTVSTLVDPDWGPMISVRFNSLYWGFGNPGVGNLLDAIEVCGSSSVAVSELPEATSLLIHPNPTSDLVVVDLSKGSEEVALYDATGRVLARYPVDGRTQCSLDLRAFEAGTYFLRCANASGSGPTGRIVKE
jgi:hypothetical protein